MHASKQLSDRLCRTIIRQRGLGQACSASCSRLACGKAVYLARSLIGPEEKQLVFADRTAEGKSELVLFEDRARLTRLVQEEIIGVENLVAQELKEGSVKRVTSGFCNQTDASATVATKSCVV